MSNDQYPRLLLLISRQTIDREQKNQDVIEAIVKGSKMGEPEIVDGADFKNLKRREQLFKISGMHAKYPQVFLLESKDAEPQFLGDYQGIQSLNEKGKFTKNAILGIEDDKGKENKENQSPAAKSTPAPATPAPATPNDSAVGDTESPKPRSLFGKKATPSSKAPEKKDASPKPRGVPAGSRQAGSTDPSTKKGFFGCFGSNKKRKADSEGASTSSSAPKKPSTPTPPPAASSDAVVGDTEPSKSRGLFGKKNTGGAPKKTAEPPKQDEAPKSKGIFGTKADDKKTQAAAPAPAPPKKTDADAKSKGLFGEKKDKTATPVTKKEKGSVATSTGHKSTARPEKVDPSDKHPKGTWYTQTTAQRLCGCCFK